VDSEQCGLRAEMRRTASLLRGAKGYSWYQHYAKGGPEVFQKNVPPTPFDWTLQPGQPPRPRAFFDISIEQEAAGRVTFELAQDILPRTVENFKLLCLGQGKKFKQGN
jgi:hypothetical protein